MDKLKIFISSTCFDSKELRETLCSSINTLGHLPIMSETSLYYSSNQTAEEACYNGIIESDIVIHILGRSFGSTSMADSQYSVAQMELKTALNKEKNTFIFIPLEVQADYQTYVTNSKKTRGIKYPHVPINPKKVFDFIDYIYKENIPVLPYNTLDELVTKFKNQLSALFHERLNSRILKARDFFTQSYTNLSNEFYNDLQNCSTLSVIGLGQKRMFTTLSSQYVDILKKNGKIDIILTDPDSESTAMCARRSSTNRGDIQNDIAIHKDTINRLLDLKSNTGTLKIYISDYMFPYTMYAFDIKDVLKTKIYIWLTPLFEPSSHRLGFLINGSNDRSTVELFIRQFNNLLTDYSTKEINTKY